MEYRLLIKEHRLKRRLTQSQLAKKAKMSQSYLSQLERNLSYAKSPTLRMFFSIAAALEVCPNVLITSKNSCNNCCVKSCNYHI